MVSTTTSSAAVDALAVDIICQRLSDLVSGSLALPSSCYKDSMEPSSAEVKTYLMGLMSDHPASFLQRYGRQLYLQELEAFQPLRHDFEVDHWLCNLTQLKRQAAEAEANPQRLPASVKNRRLAAMQRLAAGGEFFGDEAMRQRAPLLHYHLVGQHLRQEERDALYGSGTDERMANGGGASGSASQLFDTLTRQHEQQAAREQLKEEQEQFEAQLSEEEDDEDTSDENDEDRHDQRGPGEGVRGRGVGAANAAPRAATVLEGTALQRQRDELRREMESRFLTGAEHRHFDYASIDTDIDLDGHWLEQQGRDAEDKYFDSD